MRLSVITQNSCDPTAAEAVHLAKLVSDTTQGTWRSGFSEWKQTIYAFSEKRKTKPDEIVSS